MATTNASAASWGTRLVNRWRRKEYERKLKNRQTDGPLIKLTPQQKGMNVLLHLIMLLMLLYCVIPLIWLVFSSTKTNEAYTRRSAYGSMTKTCSSRTSWTHLPFRRACIRDGC